MKIIDLSVNIENNSISDPPPLRANIEYMSHSETATEMTTFFEGVTVDDLPKGLGWAVEQVQLCTHSGTHLDAPWHYHPTMNNGEKALTIDEVPLEWCIGNGVVVDFSEKPDGYLVVSEDFKNAFARMNYVYAKNDIILVYTGASKKYGTAKYLVSGCGMGREATLWLIEQGMRVCGTDAWSWDRPLPIIGKEFARTKDKNIIWEGHYAGIEKMYCHYEKLTNLDKLPKTGFQFIGLPVKVAGAGGAWVRAVAMVND